MVRGPSICKSSGGGPDEAIRRVRAHLWAGPLNVLMPPPHTKMSLTETGYHENDECDIPGCGKN